MASAPNLDFDALIAPIPGDDPAGGSVPYPVREALDQARKEISPEDYAEDDPLRPSEPKRADWPGIVRLAEATLTEKIGRAHV